MSMTSDYQHDRIVTAFFDTRQAAEKAKADVMATGLQNNTVTITDGRGASTTGATGMQDESLWGSIKSLFAPEEDQHAYAEGLHRGGFLLTAHTTEAGYDQVINILDRDGAVDMNERESQWRSEGWTGRNEDYAAAAGGTALGASAYGASSTGMSAAGTSTAAGLGSTSTAAGLGAGSTAAGYTGTAGRSTLADETVGGIGAVGARDEGTIELAEERLRVGKRDVNHGRVRLRSYVVENAVNESINLHSERVDINRRPVDRAVAAGENLFQERTISAEEHDEEAVVSKEARVVEEVSLGRVAQDRTQEIHDTVRKTEVEIEDERTGVLGERAVTPNKKI